uniref:Cytochrome b6-f complex subunit VI n=1 Tax=Udotea sp. TZ0819 TaxID=2364085 RepID=A0A386B258_9CHLO|nr:cytochrome b6-f complex subunit VI [Udotea sp. TZ0819]
MTALLLYIAMLGFAITLTLLLFFGFLKIQLI